MTKKHPHSLRNGIIAGIIATVVGGLILSAIPPLRNISKMLSWVWAVVVWVWDLLISHYPLPGWLIIIVGLYVLRCLIVGLRRGYEASQVQDEPAYWSYTEDVLDGVKWRWSWHNNAISNLWCFCSGCDAQLVYSAEYGVTSLICERCPPDGIDHQYRLRGRVVATINGDKNYAVAAAEREILRRIRTDQYTLPKT